jgi:hypothetical protein
MLLAEIVQMARHTPFSLLLIMMITKYLADLVHKLKSGIWPEYLIVLHGNVLY